jgi:hypothetical protein
MKKINVTGSIKSLYGDYRISGNRYANKENHTATEVGQSDGIFSSTLIDTLYLNGLANKVSKKRGHINIVPIKEILKRVRR